MQPQLIDQIIRDAGIENYRSIITPALSTNILHRDLEDKNFKGDFDYRSVVGNLNFLGKDSRPDIAYTVYQCERFLIDPR